MPSFAYEDMATTTTCIILIFGIATFCYRHCQIWGICSMNNAYNGCERVVCGWSLWLLYICEPYIINRKLSQILQSSLKMDMWDCYLWLARTKNDNRSGGKLLDLFSITTHAGILGAVFYLTGLSLPTSSLLQVRATSECSMYLFIVSLRRWSHCI